MEQLCDIRRLIHEEQVAEAIRALDSLLDTDFPARDEAYYLRCNAYRNQSDWQQALNDYQRAAYLNPDSPAVSARRALLDILEFYNKDMYNH